MNDENKGFIIRIVSLKLWELILKILSSSFFMLITFVLTVQESRMTYGKIIWLESNWYVLDT